MTEFDTPILQLLIATLLGAFLGIRREMDQAKGKSFMGFRTMTLIAVLGVISTFFSTMTYLPAVFFCGLLIFLAIVYANGAFNLKRIGLTTELSAILTFWIGVLVGLEQQIIAILVTILLASLNGFKDELHRFVHIFNKKEWIGALQLLIFSGAILPYLPQESIAELIRMHGIENIPFEYILSLIVPFNIWLLVIFISGIGFVGYFLSKFLGAKGGIPLTGFLGAIVSSTAVTTSMASQAKRAKLTGIFAVGILVAVATMFLRVLIEIMVWGGGIVGCKIVLMQIVMSTVAFTFAGFYFIKTTKKHEFSTVKSDVKLESPFELGPAIKFGGVFVLVLVMLAVGQKYLADSGIYVVAFLSGFVDVDAIVLSSLESVKSGEMEKTTAINAMAIAVFMNTLIKILYVRLLGGKKLMKKIATAIVATCLSGALILFLL
jgi:uncharacterized membrane protein (DUF4010 family)